MSYQDSNYFERINVRIWRIKTPPPHPLSIYLHLGLKKVNLVHTRTKKLKDFDIFIKDEIRSAPSK